MKKAYDMLHISSAYISQNNLSPPLEGDFSISLYSQKLRIGYTQIDRTDK